MTNREDHLMGHRGRTKWSRKKIRRCAEFFGRCRGDGFIMKGEQCFDTGQGIVCRKCADAPALSQTA